MATYLGWFSVGLGVTQVLAPREMARLIGVRERTGLMRACGLREIATGVGILAQPRESGWLWARAAGDVIDLALLSNAMRDEDADRSRVAAAIAAVVGVGAVDVIAGQQLGARSGHAEPRTSRRGIFVRKSTIVDRSREECYAFWRDLQNLPRFMTHIESVQVIDQRRSHWVAKAPAGARVEWDAEIVEDRPGEAISWRSLPESDVEHAGTVRFETAPGNRGTMVRVEMSYSPPGGIVAAAVAKLFGDEPRQQIPQELRRFKQLLETGELATAEGQPSGRSPLRPSVSAESPLADRVRNLDPSLVTR